MKRIVLTGGGTAGHVNPNIALIPHLLKQGWEIHYIGSKDGIEKELMEQFPSIPYHAINTGKFRRYFSLQNFTDPFRVLHGIFQARKLFKKLQPDVLFSKGGFVSVPVVYGARKTPIVLHESDYSCGLANKLCAKRADIVCVSFEPTLKEVGEKGVWTGSPIRDSLHGGSKERAQAFCQFENGDKPWLLFMGGSQGSVAINNSVTEALPKLMEEFNIVHIRGRGNLDPALNSLPSYRQYEYLQEPLPDIFAATDLFIGRSGANTVFEMLSLAIPMLLIPLPQSVSRGDQLLNASYFKELGYAAVLEQEQMEENALDAAVDSAFKARLQMKENMEKSNIRNGTKNVLEQIHKAYRQNR